MGLLVSFGMKKKRRGKSGNRDWVNRKIGRNSLQEGRKNRKVEDSKIQVGYDREKKERFGGGKLLSARHACAGRWRKVALGE